MKKKKRSGNRLIFVLLAIVVVLGILAVVGKSQGWIGKERGVEVELVQVAKQTITQKVSASGTVQPVVEVKISPEVPGEIIELAVKEGDSVNKGDFLLKIRPDNFKSALDRQQAIFNQQKVNVADARARQARAEASYTRAKLEYDRQHKLFQERVISDADFELAEANFKIARQDLESAVQSVEAAKYAMQSARASVQEAQENLQLTTISAPMSGTISKLSVELGETVVGTSQMQGTEMMRVADLAAMEVRVDVNENDIIKIKLGDTATVEVDSYAYQDKKFSGIVTQIANSANDKISSDAVTEFEVRVRILRSSYQDLIKDQGFEYPFRPGMTASVDISTETKSDVLAVPLAAVTTRKVETPADSLNNQNAPRPKDGIEEVVFVNDEGKARRVSVVTGISDFDHIEIVSGLDEGLEIVTGPFMAVSKRLKSGDTLYKKNKQ